MYSSPLENQDLFFDLEGEFFDPATHGDSTEPDYTSEETPGLIYQSPEQVKANDFDDSWGTSFSPTAPNGQPNPKRESFRDFVDKLQHRTTELRAAEDQFEEYLLSLQNHYHHPTVSFPYLLQLPIMFHILPNMLHYFVLEN